MWTAIALASIAIIVVILFLFWKGRQPQVSSSSIIHSTVEKLREIGDLSVLEANFKEIVTHTKKAGAFTKDGRMLLICSFSIEFRYDLRKIQYERNAETGNHELYIPPWFAKVNIGDIQFYHEERAAILGFIPIEFTPEERNQIIVDARKAAVQQAIGTLSNIDRKVQLSAATTLKAVLSGSGAAQAEIKFMNSQMSLSQIGDELLHVPSQAASLQKQLPAST